MKKGFYVLLLLSLVVALGTMGVSAKNANPAGQVTIVGANVETLNPLLSESTYETTVLNCIFSQLIRLTETGQLIPDLATVVPSIQNGGISKDGKIVTFKLRKDAKWQDGQPVTADDVVFTWKTIMNNDVAVVSRDGFDDITKMETPDKYTVKMYRSKVEANWLLNWAQTGGSIIPKHLWDKVKPSEFTKAHQLSRKPVGSGPFKLKEWVPGAYLILEANKDYFGKGPFLSKIIYKEVENNLTQLTMLQTGEADIALNLQGTQLDQVKAISRLKVTLNPSSTYVHMTFNLDNPVFKDKRTRQALSYALPRDLIVKNILNNVGIPAATSTSPVLWAYDKTIKPYAFDMAKAKQLLAQAGWKDTDGDGILENNGVKFKFSIATNAGRQERERIAQVAQQYWQQLGAKVDLNFQETTTLFGDTLENRKFDMIMFGWVTGADPDETSLYHSEQIPTAANGNTGQNYAGYKNPQMDKLLDQGAATMDQAKRIPIYKQIQKLVYEDLPLLYVYYMVDINVAPKNMQGWKPAPFTNATSWNAYEWKIVK